MAFVSIMFGSLVGLVTAVTGFTLFDLHIWHSLLLYSGTGIGVAALAIAILVLRSTPEPQFSASRPGGANAL